MWIFDRFRSARQAISDSDRRKAIASEQEATRLITEGHILEADGRLDEAMRHYLEAIRLAPNPARAHLNHGNILLLKGDLGGALDAFRNALKHKPDYAGACLNMGNALLGNGQYDEAVKIYHRALEIQPDYAEVHCGLGVALKELGQVDHAIANFRHALEINPDLIEARSNLGHVLGDLYNTGNTLLNSGKPDAAAASFRLALKIEPNLAEAHFNLGKALEDLGQLDNAVASYREALKIKPDFLEAHNNLGLKLQELGQLKGAMASYRRALEIEPNFIDAFDNLLFALNYTASHSPSYYLEQARLFGQVVARKVTSRFSAWQCVARPERLRVGMVSGDLREHSVGYFLEGLLTHIDQTRIELIAYPTQPKEDELTARIRPYFSEWKPLTSKGDEAAARLIHADGVHILIDLSGYTDHNRLPVFAWKPAPVQVSWLGLPSTTGITEMDYVLGDPHAIPTGNESHFSEAVWRMPESCLCLGIPASSVKVAPLPVLSAGHVTFGSFNNLTKINDAVVQVWARILLSVPNSRLLLKTKQLNDPIVRLKTHQRFAACGITPDRLFLSGILPSRDAHLATYNKVDIALDTFPFPGVTTSVEALWMGVPVLSMRGDRFISLTAASIAHNAGLQDWVAADEDDYVAKAVAFTSNFEHLAALRADLRQQVLASPLFDAPRFARNFEDALWEMWQMRTQGN